MKTQDQRFSIAAVLVIALATACERPSAPTSLEDTPENRSAQIDRYFQAMPPESLLRDVVENMTARMPDEQRANFIDLLTKQIDMAKLDSAMRDAMGKHFTADEIRALADFYASSLGKSAMAKFGNYMAEVMPPIQAEIVAAAGRIQSEMESKAAAPPTSPAEEAPAPAEPAKP